MKIKDIDNNQDFDFGKTSPDYAKFRDIYPNEFYEKIINLGLCKDGQKVLDIGTGTGVIPRNLYKYGACFTGADISFEQIEQAKLLSKGMDIDYIVSRAEDIDFKNETFDIITACQCFYYFDSKALIPKIYNMLKPKGKLVILYMGWLSLESEIAYKTEDLILKYNPLWNAAREERHYNKIPKEIDGLFDVKYEEVFDLKVHFTRTSWNGRMKTCRGVSASLSKEEVNKWENEHLELLKKYPESFEIPHFGAILVLEKR